MNNNYGKGNGYVDPSNVDFSNPSFMDAWRTGNNVVANGGNQPYNQGQKRQKPTIEITPAPFDGENATKTMLSMDLCAIISDVMAGIFVDFEGCILERNPQTNQPILKMFFVESRADKNAANNSGRLIALEPIYRPNQNTSAAFQQAACRMGGRRYKLSLDAQDVLEPLIYHKKGTKVNWGNYTQELAPNYNYNPTNYIITVQVAGFDIIKILEFIYGKTVANDDGKEEQVTYSLNILRSIASMGPWQGQRFDTEFLITVQQLNLAKLNSLASRLGMGNVSCQINMVKPTI